MLRIYYITAILILVNNFFCKKADLNKFEYYSDCFLKITEHEEYVFRYYSSPIYLGEEFFGIYFGALDQDMKEESIKYLFLKKDDKIKQIDSCNISKLDHYYDQMNENKIFFPRIASFDSYLAMFPEEAEQKFNRVVIVRGEQEIVFDLKYLREKDLENRKK